MSNMAFAAARMIKDKKEQELKKRSEEGLTRARSKLPSHVETSRSPSVSSVRSCLSSTSSLKARAGAKGLRSGNKPHPGRSTVKCVKRVKGKKGGPDRYELLVTIDLEVWHLNDEQVAEYKEVFMLFDKDEDGVLSFPELNVVMKSLGQRPSESKLLSMVRSVSEDHLYDTIEFNEFLQMMSKQQNEVITVDSLLDAFRIFDKDEDGKLTVSELKKIMSSLGERMSGRELDDLVKEADANKDGYVNYQEFCSLLCQDGGGKKKRGAHRKHPKERADRICEENKENEQLSRDGSPRHD